MMDGLTQIEPRPRGLGSSVNTIMVKFEYSLSQGSEVQIFIRLSYLEKIFYEKKKQIDEL